jgi:hypothetical protein
MGDLGSMEMMPDEKQLTCQAQQARIETFVSGESSKARAL